MKLRISEFGRLYRTVKYLKPVQIYGRILFKLRKPKPSFAHAPLMRKSTGKWIKPAQRHQSMVGATKFLIFGDECDIDKFGWDDPLFSKLCRYNLHYFDDLNAQNSNKRDAWHVSIIDRWILDNPATQGSGWEPYPTSLRIVNWIKWFQSKGIAPSFEQLHSLAIQVRYLNQRLEWHLLGNHLFVNAKALVFAGLFFEGAEADSWLKTGLSILKNQVPEQMLADGGQFELSPMYHALAVEDMLDIANIVKQYENALLAEYDNSIKAWEHIIPKMLHWLQVMSHPDGKISFFNDAAFGIAPETDELLKYAKRLNFSYAKTPRNTLFELSDSGYARLNKNDVTAIVDVASVGPNYLPGHAHADTLSFELSVGAQRVIVNGGTSEYGLSAERHYQRGTNSHSTLCLNDENSSEVWAGFRVGRRAAISDLEFRKSNDGQIVKATHNGYAHLTGKPLHTRQWELNGKRLIVTDVLDGQQMQNAVINFHLHPDITAKQNADGSITLRSSNKKIIGKVRTTFSGGIYVSKSSWHPVFGKAISSSSIHINVEACLPLSGTTTFDWTKK